MGSLKLQVYVTKRNGVKETLDLEKFHRVASFACSDLAGVSSSELEIKTHLQVYDNIKTIDIQETLIKAASELISEEQPNYQYVAGRLINYALRKEVYGQFEPISLAEHIITCISNFHYDPVLMDSYTLEDMQQLNGHINHERDLDLTYAAMEQMRGKYLVKNRVTGDIKETPQMAMMCIAMVLFQDYRENRIKWVVDLYNALSTFDISLPTPIMAGVHHNASSPRVYSLKRVMILIRLMRPLQQL
jgi:ribonucleoside-diphosphate reductase alpha chain